MNIKFKNINLNEGLKSFIKNAALASTLALSPQQNNQQNNQQKSSQWKVGDIGISKSSKHIKKIDPNNPIKDDNDILDHQNTTHSPWEDGFTEIYKNYNEEIKTFAKYCLHFSNYNPSNFNEDIFNKVKTLYSKSSWDQPADALYIESLMNHLDNKEYEEYKHLIDNIKTSIKFDKNNIKYLLKAIKDINNTLSSEDKNIMRSKYNKVIAHNLKDRSAQ